MEDHNTGGSYIRQKDGSLKLVDRTEEAKPETADPIANEPDATVDAKTPADSTAASKKGA